MDTSNSCKHGRYNKGYCADCEVSLLREANRVLTEGMTAIAFHDGHVIRDISRNKALEGYRNCLHVAKKALAKARAIMEGK